MRMHLKGRPVPLYAPTNLEDYDVRAPQDPPNAELKLEWVYPCITFGLACFFAQVTVFLQCSLRMKGDF